jgi:pyruvate formate lyase activating enzyme
MSYGLVSSSSLDPIEKKPLYRFHPGTAIFSIGSFGCNLRCPFCQNHGISMVKPIDGEYTSPAQIAEISKKLIPRGNIGIAYTYNEPLIGYEFIKDCAILLRKQNQKNVLVTNGYINRQPFLELLPYIDALNIDLKGFGDFYKKVKGRLDIVKENIALAAEAAHVEITTLIIPGENDGDEEIDALAMFISGINAEIPLHLSRFFPKYEMTDKPPTPPETILRLKKIAEKYLKYVYAGNMG